MDKESKIIDYLIMNNALEVAGVDSSTGEPLYVFTEKLQEVMPELYNTHKNSVNSEIMTLWEKGFVDIDFFAKDPIITLNNKSFDENEISKLSNSEIWSLNEIKRITRL